MSRLTPIETIVRLLPERDEPSDIGPNERVVLFDPRSGDVVPKRPFWGRRIQAFQVSLNRRTEIVLQRRIRSVARTGELEIVVHLDLCCLDGAEGRVVEALGPATNPNLHIESLVDDALSLCERRLIKESTDPVASFLDDTPSWVEQLQGAIEEQTGLDAAITLGPKDRVDIFEHSEDFFRVYASDSPEELSLSFDYSLSVRDQVKANLRQRDLSGLPREFCKAVRSWTQESIRLQEFCENKESLRRRLVEVLERVAESYGRSVERFHLTLPKDALRIPEGRSRLRRTYPVQSNAHELEIEHAYAARVHDLARFRAAEVGDLIPWLDRQFEAETRRLVFAMDYVELAQSFETTASEAIRGAMERTAESIGCALAEVTVEGLVPEIPYSSEPLQEEFKHECKLARTQLSVPLSHRYRIQVTKPGRFRGAGIDDLRQWMNAELRRVTEDVLFEWDYVKIALHFESDLQSSIKEKVEERATSIGCSLQHFTSLLDIEPLVYMRDGFPIRLERETFVLNDPSVSVDLTVVGKGTLESLKPIEGSLRGDQKVDLNKTVFEPAVREAVARVLHKVTPEEFFTEYYPASKEKNDAKPSTAKRSEDEGAKLSTEERIKQSVLDDLAEKFNATAELTVKHVHSRLAERVKKLMQARPVSRRTKVIPRGGLELEFQFGFRVSGVAKDQWSVFQQGHAGSVEDELAAIGDLIEEKLQEQLGHTYQFSDVLYQSGDHRSRLEKWLFQGVHPETGENTGEGILLAIQQHHGLMILLTSFRREEAEHEKIKRKRTLERVEMRLTLENRSESRLFGKLRILEEREEQLLKSENLAVDDDELRSVQDEIQVVQEQLQERARKTDTSDPYVLPQLDAGGRPHFRALEAGEDAAQKAPAPPSAGAAAARAQEGESSCEVIEVSAKNPTQQDPSPETRSESAEDADEAS